MMRYDLSFGTPAERITTSPHLWVESVTGLSQIPARKPVGSPSGLFEPAECVVNVVVQGSGPATAGLEATDQHRQLANNLNWLLSQVSGAKATLNRTHGPESLRRVLHFSDAMIAEEDHDIPPYQALVKILGRDRGFFWRGDTFTATQGIGTAVAARDSRWVSRGAMAPNLDATVAVTGPTTNLRIDFGDGYLLYNGALTGSQTALFDPARQEVTVDGSRLAPSMIIQGGAYTSPGQWFVHNPAREFKVSSQDGTTTGTWTLAGNYKHF